ncbi:MAG: DAHL domain-containing protein [Cyanobacteria bacterium P01_H01_bin.105]
MKYRPIILSAAASALLVWLGLLAKGRSVTLDEHVRYQEYLSKQIQQDLIVNQTFIEVQRALQPSYEPLVQELHQVRKRQDKLENIPGFINYSNSQQLQEILKEGTRLLTQKADLADQFQTQNLPIKDSLSALQPLVNDIRQESISSAERQVYESLIDLLDDVWRYTLASDQALAADIKLKLGQLQTLVDANNIRDRNDINTALRYVDIILETKPQVEQLSQSLLALPTTQQFQTLSKTYEEAYREADQRASLFQLAAAVWGIGLLGGAVYLRLLGKQARNVEKITNFLSESIDDAFIDVDSQWRITYANTQASKDLEKSPEELIGQLVWTILPAELGQDQKPYYQEARNRQSVVTFETRFSAKSRWLEFRLSPSKDGLSIFWQDISTRKKAEFQLALSLAANDEALKKAYEAQKKAEAERLKAEQANQAKSEFLANMSHELRTPLNAIIGYSEMLEEDAEDLGQEDFIPELQKIHGAGKHLLGLINDVLDLSKVEAGHMEMYLETFNLRPLVKDVASTMQPSIAKNNNILKVEYSDNISEMYADPVKVRQSLFNLLSNASKFTQNGTITLRVSATDVDNNNWIDFQIQDTGIGMMPEQLQKVFNAFSQADSSTTRKYGGTGLGLTITKRFVQMMGGIVNVQSKVGQGTTFTLRIPKNVQETSLSPSKEIKAELATELTIPQSQTQAQDATSDSSAVSLTKVPCSGCVLVIDEDTVTCELIWKTLVSQGYFVVLTHNIRKGLKMAAQLQPDIILLAPVMLEVDRRDTVKFFKERSNRSKPLIILKTDQTDQHIVNMLGMTDFLAKPVIPTRLLQMLEKYELPHQEKSFSSVDQ